MKGHDIRRWVRERRRHWQRLNLFLRQDVWDLNLSSFPPVKGFFLRLLRVVLLVFRGFRNDECSMHASALTFSTLMAIVPVLALCLSMARGLGDADTAKRWIQNRVQDWTATFRMEEPAGGGGGEGAAILPADEDRMQNELALRINSLVEKGFEKVDNINFAKLGTLGLVVLIWMVTEVLGRVERSFNRVWGITKGRSLWRRFTDYLSVLLILPVLIVAAASLPIVDMVTSYMPDSTADLIRQFAASGLFKNLVVLVMTTLAFSFVIMFMPNTAMKVRSGLSGGFVAAVLFLIWLWICAMLQVGAARYGKIYGSFALAPILLAWVHVSWQIVLFGAEVAFSVENCDTFRMEQSAGDANARAKLTLSLSIVLEAARCLVEPSVPPFNLTEYGHRKKLPVRLLHFVTDDLVRAGFLAPLAGFPETFVLLKAPGALTVSDILSRVFHSGAGVEDLGLTQVEPSVKRAVDTAFSGMDGSLQSMTVAALLDA